MTLFLSVAYTRPPRHPTSHFTAYSRFSPISLKIPSPGVGPNLEMLTYYHDPEESDKRDTETLTRDLSSSSTTYPPHPLPSSLKIPLPGVGPNLEMLTYYHYHYPEESDEKDTEKETQHR
jgi:hypothetical protein